MNLFVLTLIVIGQIVVFQFAAVAFTRSLFGAVLGTPAGPADGKPATYLRSTGRCRFILGGVLIVFALVSLIVFPGDSTVRKLVLAAMSLTSSVAFGYAALTDRRAVRSMRDALPESGVRRASLRPRAISHWYKPAWEIIPITTVFATAVGTIISVNRLGHIPTGVWVLQIIQIAFVIGALIYTFRHGIAVPNVSARLAMFRDEPELALALGERLAEREMQFFMLAKIGVTLLLGVGVIQNSLEALGHPAAPLLGSASWVIIGLLLVLFAGFVWQIASLTRRAQHHAERHRREADAKS